VTLEAPAEADRFAADVAFARALAERAGRLLLERYERVEHVAHKSPKDVVTEVDHLSERLVLDAIRDRYPDDRILAEESGAHGPRSRTAGRQGPDEEAAGTDDRPAAEAGSPDAGSAEAIARSLASGRTWIVDPVDGTINYANGIPFFCVSIALVVDGHPAAGAIHDPMRGETFSATADGPALLGDRPVSVSGKEKLSDLVVSLALGGQRASTRARAVRRAIRVSRSMGSAALALAYVANGRFDAFVQSGGMSAWDVAAAGLIAERAGALVTDASGGPWFDVAKATRTFGLLAAPPAHHAELLRLSREP
jgi:myo-inositol-1(or 4)-monophosphatase